MKLWDPLKIIFQKENCSNYIFIVLNTAIKSHIKRSSLLDLWNKACLRVTVDGGTVRWFSWLKANNINEKSINSLNFITGDLDSIPSDFLEKVKIKFPNVEVIKTLDQNETDFTKSLMVIQQKIVENNLMIPSVVVLVDSSGRIDQIMGNVNTLFKAKSIVPKSTVYLLGSDSLSWLLYEGSHSISIPPNLINTKSWCSLVPIGSPAVVTTTGLKWNLNNSVLEFGNLVSTSNTYNGDSQVTIKTNASVLWSMGLLPIFENSQVEN